MYFLGQPLFCLDTNIYGHDMSSMLKSILYNEFTDQMFPAEEKNK